MLAFLLHSAVMAVEEDKGERKEAKDQGVFFWFGDEQGGGRAGNHHSQIKASRRADAPVQITCRKTRRAIEILIGGGEGKVAYGIGQSALPAPRNRDAVGVAERSCPRDAKAQRVGGMVVLQADVADGSGAGRRGDLRRAVSIRGQGMVGGRVVSGGSVCSEELGAGRVGEVAAGGGEGEQDGLAGSVVRVIRLSSDGGGKFGCGRAGERPDGCVVGVALKGIDGENQLRLALLKRGQRQQRCRRHPSRYQSRLIADARCPIFDNFGFLAFKYF